jgi:hypothetical protein
MAQMWPIFPILVGASLFVGWLATPNKRENHGMMIPVVVNVLIGIFFFGFTFSIFDWSDMAILWPVFPLIVGAAFFVAWIFGLFRDWGLLVPAGIAAGVGVVGLAFTLSGRYEFLGSVRDYWPVLLIGLGLLILISSLVDRGRKAPSREETIQAFKSPDETQD